MRIRRIAAVMLILATAWTTSASAAGLVVQDAAERWHDVISRLEPAAFVSLRLRSGDRVKGTVLAAGDRTFTFMPHTRIPVAAREVAYDDVAALERARQGMSPGMKVLIGAGAGVGGFLLFVITALAVYGD